ncbi:ImmA/IrrE family metallo-endopeptidase [Gordonia sp. HNM0687]|uniref:ImmA/IrrE family metallo-endopeptidase n=1 Tax=Gordonia mangrovi TaxID=2665643 RepID=A0A6L7GJP8_9ACTN|nr:ImmA/IrrE family metallo-endopeptidase [Gordonia mangrovi]MXP20159.1 ImmA/IrrE family metallo-endopeptidase [Gordonia mangrovi]UVF79234.1 ImmA/IrrE family metallo-endopeptidase [Gordonia mangrovi]
MRVEAQARAAAAAFRADHHLGAQPLGDVITVIEQTTGIDVAVLDVGPDEHGLAMRDPDRHTVMIAVAKTRSPLRQRSALAHELAHVVFEDWTDAPESKSPSSPVEQRARAFARHLLVPIESIADTVEGGSSAGLADLSRVVQLFGVSPAIAAIVMGDAGVIHADTVERWKVLTTPQVAARFGWLDHYETLQQQSDRPRAPQKLVSRLIAGYVDNVVSAQTIATVLGQRVAAVIANLEQQGIAAKPLTVEWGDSDDLPAMDHASSREPRRTSRGSVRRGAPGRLSSGPDRERRGRLESLALSDS